MTCLRLQITRGTELGLPPVIMRNIPTHLLQVSLDLKQACEVAGYDWQAVHCDLDTAPPRRGDLGIRELGEVSFSFTLQLTEWLKIYRESEPMARASWGEALLVLQWYGVLIGPKVQRALDGLQSSRIANAPVSGPDRIRSDGNASAKVAVLAAIRTLAALGVMLRNPAPFEEELLTFTLDLLRVQQCLRHYYPYLASFERPGFDDPDMQEEIEAFYQGFAPLDPFRDGPWQAVGGRAPQG
jgi:hypothetical protein